MSVDQYHPQAAQRLGDWQTMRDCLEGESAIKARGDLYLPMTPGQRLEEADPGRNADYQAYRLRADFPDLVRLTLDSCVGLIHRQPATITLPSALEPLRRQATPDGLSLADLHRRITRNVLLTGRHGLLVEGPAGDGEGLYLADYAAEAVINWRLRGAVPELVVLREEVDGPGHSPFGHVIRPQWRVLSLEDGRYTQWLWRSPPQAAGPGPEPRSLAARAGSPASALTGEGPVHPGGLGALPFVFAGATDLTPAPDRIPLLPLARIALRIYRLSADYKQALFLTSQPTPVIAGVENNQDGLPEQIGASTIWYLPPEARAFYLEVDGQGIEAHRQAIRDLYDQAWQMGARLLEGGRGVESAEALRLRSTAQTVSLTDVARTTAAALEQALGHAARWLGEDPARVRVEPNLDFTQATLSPEAVRDLTEAWRAGAFDHSVLAWNLRRGGRLPDEPADESDRTA